MPYATKRKRERVWFFLWNGDMRHLKELREYIPHVTIYNGQHLDKVWLSIKTERESELIIPPNAYIVQLGKGSFSALAPDLFHETYNKED